MICLVVDVLGLGCGVVCVIGCGLGVVVLGCGVVYSVVGVL